MEEVAKLIAKYDISAIPVVDEQGRLVGRITVDDVMDVMEEEASEDIVRLAGSDEAELTNESPLVALKARLPWLLITLVTSFVTSLILKAFMHDLSEILILTIFVPIVMAMGGSTGIQSSTLAVRGLALGTIDHRRIWHLFRKEMATGAMMGILCGAIIGAWVHYALRHDATVSVPAVYLSATVAVALFSAMTFAELYGAFVPVMLNRVKIDPAVASGPFVTASNDIAALLIYYVITVLLIGAYPLLFGGSG